MCGIAGIFLRTDKAKLNLNEILDTMLDEIRDRGGDACGYLAMGAEGVLEWQRASCDVYDFKKYRRQVPKGTRTILAHTRWATQGLAAFMENNHPVRRGPFYVIHNGHVANDHELFKLTKRERFAQVDTEAIPAVIAWYGSLDRVDEAMERIEGAAAIAVVDEKNPEQLVLARGYSSPLNVLITDKVILWGSTERTVRMAYKKHIGKLPKRAQIVSLAEGTMIHVNAEGQIDWIKFKPYVPVYTYTPANSYRTGWAWQESPATQDAAACEIPAAKELSQGNGHFWDDPEDWDDEFDIVDGWKAEDVLDKSKTTECDECGGEVPLMHVIRVDEPDADHTWSLCEECADLWERLTNDEYERANAQSLSELDR